jgi:hypothetical protein
MEISAGVRTTSKAPAIARNEQSFKAFVLSRYGIHWPELDEDLCFEGLFADAGIYKPSNAEDTIYYQA